MSAERLQELLAGLDRSQPPPPMVPGNIDLHRRPVVRNQDGTVSTVRSISIEEDGQEILIPTVGEDGQVLSDDEAVDLFHRTGKHLGVFSNAEDATRFAESLHQQQQEEYSPSRFAELMASLDDKVWDPLAKKFQSKRKLQERASQMQAPGPDTEPPVDVLAPAKEAAKALGRGLYTNLPKTAAATVEGLASAAQQVPGPWSIPDLLKRQLATGGVNVPVPTPLEAAQAAGGGVRQAVREAEEGGFLQPEKPPEGDFLERLKKDTGQTLVEAMLENAPQLIVTVAATAATGGAGGLASAFGLEFGNAYDQAKEDGADENNATMAAVLTAAPNALLERVVPGHVVQKLGSSWPGVAKALKDIGVDMLIEGGTEGVQSFNQKLMQVATYAGENGLTGNDLRSLFSTENLRQYGSEAIIGALIAGPMSGAALASGAAGPVEGSGGAGVRTAETPPAQPGSVAPVTAGAEATTETPAAPQKQSSTEIDEPTRAGEIVQQTQAALRDLQQRLATGQISEAEAQQRLVQLGRVEARLTDQPLREMAAATEQIGETPSPQQGFEEQASEAMKTLGLPSSEVAKSEPAAGPVQASPPQTPAKTDTAVPPVVTAGPKDTVIAGDQDVPVRWAVVDVADLRPSHRDTGVADRAVLRPNPDYDPSLQPRQRTREASATQVTKMSQRLDPRRLAGSMDAGQGAPIVGPDLQVESGNARAVAIERAYRLGTERSNEYRNMVTREAEQRGLSTEGIAQPVLVRVREGELDSAARQELVRRMNEPAVSRMAGGEQAAADAQRLSDATLEGLNPTESGEISLANSPEAVQGFLRALPETEAAALRDPNGRLNQEGERRLTAAVLARALGNDEAVGRMVESTSSEIANLRRAVMVAAPEMAKQRQAMDAGTRIKDLDLAPVVAEVANELDSLRQQGKKVTDELAQGTIFGRQMDPETELLLRIAGGDTEAQAKYGLDRPAAHRSAKVMGQVLKRYVELVDAAGDPRQKSLISGSNTRLKTLEAAFRSVSGYQASIFERGPSTTEHFQATAPSPEPIVAKPSESGAVEVPAAGIRKWFKKWWTTTGLLRPQEHEVRRAYHHRLAAHVEEIEYIGRELNAKLRNYKGPLSQKQLVRYLDDALRGMNVQGGAETLDETQIARIAKERNIDPEKIRARLVERQATGLEAAPEFLETIGRMRSATDALTRSLRREGLLTDSSARELERHYGLYVNRGYKAFNDPQWKDRVKRQPMWNRFADILSSQVPDLSAGQIEGMMEEYISRIGSRPPSLPGGIIEGSKQMGPLRQRKGMEDMRRMLLGEYRDVRANYANTLAHMAQIVEAHRMLKELEASGKGEVFLEKPEVKEGVSYTAPIDPAFYQQTMSKLAQGRVPLEVRASAKGRQEAARRGIEVSLIKGSGVGGRVLLTDVYRFAKAIKDDPSYTEVEPLPVQGTKKAPSGQRGMPRTQPLSGLYTSPEILEDLEEDLKSQETSALFRAYMKLNFAVKTAKTVGSIQTTDRNLLSNSLYLTANGHSPLPLTPRAARDFREALSIVVGDLAHLNNQQLLERRQELLSLGILDQGTDIGDLRRISREGKLITDVPAEKVVNLWRAVFKKAGDLYQAMDDLPKLIAFGHELATQRKAYPDRPDAQNKEAAAKIVRDTMQNYGELPRGVRKASTHPLLAPFFSFGAELVRNAKNIAKQSKAELASDNAVIRARGRQRLAGVVMAAALPEMFATLGMLANNMGDDEEEALRRFVYEWDRESNLQVLSFGKGQVSYFDWGWLDVWARLKEPLMALMRSDKETDRLTRALETAGEPLGEEILVSKILDAARNKQDFGGQVYNEQAPWARKARQVALHIGEAFEPGTSRSARRIWQAHQGVVLPSGRKLQPWQEWLALAGPRVVTLDIREVIGAKGRSMVRDLSEATYLFTQVANTRGTPDKEQIVKRYREMQEARLDLLRSLRFDIEAAEILEVPSREVDKALRDAGVPRKYITAARANRFVPHGWANTKHGQVAADELREIFGEYWSRTLE